jgi:hypothetical protein
MNCQAMAMGCDGDVTHLEKVIDDEAMLTGEEAEASPKEESLTIMSYDHVLVTVTTDVPSNPCLLPSQYRHGVHVLRKSTRT